LEECRSCVLGLLTLCGNNLDKLFDLERDNILKHLLEDMKSGMTSYPLLTELSLVGLIQMAVVSKSKWNKPTTTKVESALSSLEEKIDPREPVYM
jgi:hypothetical protein